MTAPGGSSGEADDHVLPPAETPWASPAADYPPPADYPWDAHAGYPPPVPPLAYPGYQPHPAPPAMPGPYDAAPYRSGYYPPSFNYPGGYGPGQGVLQSGMNTMAIVSLVGGIVGIFCCIGSVASLVCGPIGINEIKRTGEDGFGLAVAGIVISTATLLVYFVLMMIGLGSR